VYYRLAEEPSSPATVAALVVVRGAFAGRGSAQMSRRRRGELDGIEEELFAAFTAFTHPRRLGILRHLDARGETEAEVLSEALSMSPAATTRHLSKLSRRGLVVAQTGQGRTVYVLAGEAPATASELLRAVLAAMGDRSI